MYLRKSFKCSASLSFVIHFYLSEVKYCLLSCCNQLVIIMYCNTEHSVLFERKNIDFSGVFLNLWFLILIRPQISFLMHPPLDYSKEFLPHVIIHDHPPLASCDIVQHLSHGVILSVGGIMLRYSEWCCCQIRQCIAPQQSFCLASKQWRNDGGAGQAGHRQTRGGVMGFVKKGRNSSGWKMK